MSKTFTGETTDAKTMREAFEAMREALRESAEVEAGRCTSCNAEIAPEGYCGCAPEDTVEYDRRIGMRAALALADKVTT